MNPQPVYLYVLDGMADWEAAYAIAGISRPAYQAAPGRYEVRTVGARREAVRTMGSVTIVPDVALDEVDPGEGAMLILPGAESWEQGEHGAAVRKAGEFLEAGVPVAAICGATAGLAREGVLNARAHTSNAPEYLAMMPGYAGHRHYVSAPAVRDGSLITASGLAPLDFARRIFEALDLYEPRVLDAWYALYAKGDPAGFYALGQVDA